MDRQSDECNWNWTTIYPQNYHPIGMCVLCSSAFIPSHYAFVRICVAECYVTLMLLLACLLAIWMSPYTLVRWIAFDKLAPTTSFFSLFIRIYEECVLCPTLNVEPPYLYKNVVLYMLYICNMMLLTENSIIIHEALKLYHWWWW